MSLKIDSFRGNKYFYAFLLSSLAFCLCLESASAATLSCNSCSTCTSQLAAASSGDTVELTADLTESLATCITFSATSGVIFDCQDHTLTGPYSGGIPIYFFGIKMLSANNNTLRNCTVQNFYENINVEGSSGNTFDNITSVGSFQNGLLIHDFSSNNNIMNCTANSNGNRGIYIYYYCNGNNVSHSSMSANDTGINVEYSSGNILDDLTLDGNNYGVSIGFAENNTLRNSHIENGVEHGGLYIPPGFNSDYVRYNNIYNNYFSNTVNVEIAGIADNQPNYFNSTLDCSSGENIIGGACIGGNFWTTPTENGYSDTCMDANENGVCDTAYTFSANNVDNYPLTYPPAGDTTPPTLPTGLSVT